MCTTTITHVCNLAYETGNEKSFFAMADLRFGTAVPPTNFTKYVSTFKAVTTEANTKGFVAPGWEVNGKGDEKATNAKNLYNDLRSYCKAEALKQAVLGEPKLKELVAGWDSGEVYAHDAHCRGERVGSDARITQLQALAKAKLGVTDERGAFAENITQQKLCNVIRDEATARATSWWITMVSVMSVLVLLGLVAMFLFGRKKGARSGRRVGNGRSRMAARSPSTFQSAGARPTVTGAPRRSARSSVRSQRSNMSRVGGPSTRFPAV